MGYSVDAHLIWGIPISAYDEDGEPTKFWDEESSDWIDFAEIQLKRDGVLDPHDEVPRDIWHGYDDNAFREWKAAHPDWEGRSKEWYALKRQAEKDCGLRIEHYGHCDDPDGPRAILSSTRIETIDGDAWTPKQVSRDDLHNEASWDKLYSKAEDAARCFDLGVSFYGDAAWWLVASYG